MYQRPSFATLSLHEIQRTDLSPSRAKATKSAPHLLLMILRYVSVILGLILLISKALIKTS